MTIALKNTTSTTACIGFSLATSYAAGIQSLCVRPHSVGVRRESGPAIHYLESLVSIFLTNNSKSAPLAPETSRSSFAFTLTFAQP
jgi:hypothetical protein